MHTIKKKVYERLKNEIYTLNTKLLAVLKDKMERKEILRDNNPLTSVEFIKIAFSSHLLEDLEFLISLSGNEPFKIRHATIIIRDILEQTIEFIYLLKYPELIGDYMGSNIELGNNNTDLDDEKNLVGAMLQYGQGRYIGGRKPISKMAEKINEKSHKGDRLSLYEIYRLLSEDSHNSYFHAILDDIEMLEEGEINTPLTESQITYLILIIDAFMSAYREGP